MEKKIKNKIFDFGMFGKWSSDTLKNNIYVFKEHLINRTPEKPTISFISKFFDLKSKFITFGAKEATLRLKKRVYLYDGESPEDILIRDIRRLISYEQRKKEYYDALDDVEKQLKEAGFDVEI